MSSCDKTLSTLGLCKRAGKIVVGFDAVFADIAKSAGVITAVDLSDKSKKEVAFRCGKANTPFCEIAHTMAEIESVLGKRTGIISILDKGLYDSITKPITSNDECRK